MFLSQSLFSVLTKPPFVLALWHILLSQCQLVSIHTFVLCNYMP